MPVISRTGVSGLAIHRCFGILGLENRVTYNPLGHQPNPEIPKLIPLQMKRAAGYKPAHTWSGLQIPTIVLAAYDDKDYL